MVMLAGRAVEKTPSIRRGGGGGGGGGGTPVGGGGGGGMSAEAANWASGGGGGGVTGLGPACVTCSPSEMGKLRPLTAQNDDVILIWRNKQNLRRTSNGSD